MRLLITEPHLRYGFIELDDDEACAALIDQVWFKLSKHSRTMGSLGDFTLENAGQNPLTISQK